MGKIQEKQMTTYYDNVFPFAINNNFDECQTFVKKAFVDDKLVAEANLKANIVNRAGS